MKLRKILIGLTTLLATLGLISCGGGGGSSSVLPATYTVGGTLTGSVGNVVLKINGAGDISLATPGAFTFTDPLAVGAAYAVSASGTQNCNVVNGTGTVGGSNIINVAITCTTVVRTATLSGAQESPPKVTTATGSGAVIVNPTTKEITGGMSFTGLTPSAGGHHIHQAPAGNAAGNGPVIIGLTLAPDNQTATVPAGTVLTDAQYAALLAGELYFNVHTTANPAGEIRGQINLRGGVTAALATLNGGQEVPINASTATGRGMIVFDSTTRAVVIGYATHNVVAANNAHIHTGAAGVSGPVTVALTAGTNIYTAPFGTVLSAQTATDIGAGNTYFNVHSPTSAAGEIRGQIAAQ